MVPNFFLKVKGSDGSAAVAKRQACYDGVLGDRDIYHLQLYGETENIYDGNAYTITSVYHDGALKMYTIHPTSPLNPGYLSEYHMTQLRSFAMTDSG